mmetsp:Transcript_29857/g.62348  ORF Transcript_29857/g.62348 Transcript_29857/m.62348 type:complete len:204 (+) Transcript_29857:556-1167(+)
MRCHLGRVVVGHCCAVASSSNQLHLVQLRDEDVIHPVVLLMLLLAFLKLLCLPFLALVKFLVGSVNLHGGRGDGHLGDVDFLRQLHDMGVQNVPLVLRLQEQGGALVGGGRLRIDEAGHRRGQLVAWCCGELCGVLIRFRICLCEHRRGQLMHSAAEECAMGGVHLRQVFHVRPGYGQLLHCCRLLPHGNRLPGRPCRLSARL